MAGDKIRLRFSKTGPLRLLSHHDLMRAAERMLRRAELPFRSTQGFHPTPRFVFALPAPLGAECLNEVVELELLTPLEPDDVRARLNAVAPEGLAFRRAREVPLKVTAMVRSVKYTLSLPMGLADATEAKVVELLSAEKVWVERQIPNPRRLNVRPFVEYLSIEHSFAGYWWLEMFLWVTPAGTARADEIIRLVGLEAHHRAGALLTRIAVEIHDEVSGADAADGPPQGPAEVVRLDRPNPRPAPNPAGFGSADVSSEIDAAGAGAGRGTWGLSPNGPEVE